MKKSKVQYCKVKAGGGIFKKWENILKQLRIQEIAI